MITSHLFTRLLRVFRVLVVIAMFFSQLGWVESQAATLADLCYVDAHATGANNGTSWADAFTNLQSALGGSSCTEIWVAAGIYKPATGTDRSVSFQLKNGVALFGGFTGSETTREQRNPTANLTILSGDIDNNDSQKPIITDLATTTGNDTNSWHVVKGADGATLDGFTITAGYASGDPPGNYGGGMFNEAGSPTITNVTFSGNYAEVCGGGMSNLSGSNPKLTGVIFSGNTVAPSYSTGLGGGMYTENSSPELENVIFTGNSTLGDPGRGGGMYNYSGTPILTNVTFNGNSVSNNGAALYNSSSNMVLTNVTFNGNIAKNGAGMYNLSGNPTLTNVTFSDNSVISYGGGMYNLFGNPMLTNVTFHGNTAGSEGGGMYNDASNPQIRNTILWGNSAAGGGAQIANGGSTPSLSDSVVEAGCPADSMCINIIVIDPLLGTLGNYGGFTQTIPLQPGSSAIDTGNDATCATSDQRGVTRPQGAHCDIGAFEYFRPAISGNTGVADATITYAGGSTTANSNGNYIFSVPFGWTGTVTPSKTGYTFLPVSRSYTNVTTNQANQDYTATVIVAITTTNIVLDAPDPSGMNQAVTVAVNVTGSSIPTGLVSITGADTNCDITLTSGSGMCEAVFRTPGEKIITATYKGDPAHLGSSDTETHYVNGVTTTNIIAFTPEPSVFNQLVNVNVTVSGDATTPTGSVSITGADINCIISLSSGSGNCDVLFTSPGPRTITATYNGDLTHASSSDTKSHTVNRATTITTITADAPDPSLPGHIVSVSVIVSGTSIKPTGTVAITGADVNCTITLFSGSGTCNIVFLTIGSRTITATYSGDTNYISSSITEPHEVIWIYPIYLPLVKR